MILQGLKPYILTQEGEHVHARLNTRAGKWAVEVPSVLWSLLMMPNRLTGFTPFFMVHGAQAVLPTDLQYGSPRVRAYQLGTANEAQKNVIDLLEESRDTTVIRSVKYQHALRHYHARRVYPQAFRRVTWSYGGYKPIKESTNYPHPGKEGPYLIAELL
jgi:hypothetical protein